MERFFGKEFAAGGVTSVWIPGRINATWVRCTACARMADHDQARGRCACGEPLPEPPPFW